MEKVHIDFQKLNNLIPLFELKLYICRVNQLINSID